MNKLYKNDELWFSIVFIIIYVLGASLCDTISMAIGIDKIITLPFLIALTIFLLYWIKRNNLLNKYGLCKPHFSCKNFLFYIPLVVLILINCWFGLAVYRDFTYCVLNVGSMLCVGIVEEIIFRGFLFKAMEKNNAKMAIIVTSLTFGFGHIINLLFSPPQQFIYTIFQIIGAIAIGFLFVIIFYKGGSLIPCIITHCLINAISLFSVAAMWEIVNQIITTAVIVVVAVSYSVYIVKCVKPKISSNYNNMLDDGFTE